MARFRVGLDPRIELLAVVQSLGGYGERLHLINRRPCAYRRRIDAWFGRLAGHAAVASFDQLSQAGFDFAAPPAALLCLGRPPRLRRRLPFPGWVSVKAGGEVSLAAFIRYLRGFARESGFMEDRKSVV